MRSERFIIPYNSLRKQRLSRPEVGFEGWDGRRNNVAPEAMTGGVRDVLSWGEMVPRGDHDGRMVNRD